MASLCKREAMVHHWPAYILDLGSISQPRCAGREQMSTTSRPRTRCTARPTCIRPSSAALASPAYHLPHSGLYDKHTLSLPCRDTTHLCRQPTRQRLQAVATAAAPSVQAQAWPLPGQDPPLRAFGGLPKERPSPLALTALGQPV